MVAAKKTVARSDAKRIEPTAGDGADGDTLERERDGGREEEGRTQRHDGDQADGMMMMAVMMPTVAAHPRENEVVAAKTGRFFYRAAEGDGGARDGLCPPTPETLMG